MTSFLLSLPTERNRDGLRSRGIWDPYEDKFVMRHHFDLSRCIGLPDFIFGNQAIFIGYLGKKLEELAITNTLVKKVSKFTYKRLTKAILCSLGNPLGFIMSG